LVIELSENLEALQKLPAAQNPGDNAGQFSG
jgi:hypothetical protein